jgi:hypothetical protein
MLEDKKVKIQNMFQYLCKKNLPSLLETWLLKESNYLSDGLSPSPMSLTSVVCAPVVNKWLQGIDKVRQSSIYESFSKDDLIAILDLPTSIVS